MTGIYLKDPSRPSYSEASVHPGSMMLYMNYSSSAKSFSDTLAGNSQPQQKSDDLPSLGSSESAPAPEGILSNLGGSHLEEDAYSVWRDGRNEMLFLHPTGGGTSTGENLVHSSVTEDPQVSMQTQLGILHGRNLQGLSLSLGTQIPSAVPGASFHYPHLNTGFSSFLSPHQSVSGEDGNGTGSCIEDENSHREQLRNGEYLPNDFPGSNHDVIREEEVNNLHWSNGPNQMHRDPSPYGLPGLASSIANSKYLKAAQQLLDEVVNVRKSLKKPESVLKSGTTLAPISGGPSNPQESTANASGELSPAERQDLQNKLTKLLSMLDEVDRRFKQYYHQMQIVVSSFDVVAGCGAAKSYTALALQTISRHFRCLRDAISGQIQTIRRSLGEQDTSANSKECGISRLRYVDQQLRQQRALQQLGMVQQNAWRPQRGLPDGSVSILRAWLFEHFLNPYPKDSDKIMLARQTGLTRSQVSNWFINARVRLWKPMIEDIYKEEIGDTEIDSNSSSENAHNPTSNPTNEEELQKNMDSTTTERCHPGQFHDLKPNIIPDVEMTRGTLEAGFQMAEFGRFVGGNSVSLKLELQNRDAASVPVSGGTHHHNFVTMREDEMYNAAVSSVGPDGEDYDYMDQVNRRSSFGPGPGRMLRDFVA